MSQFLFAWSLMLRRRSESFGTPLFGGFLNTISHMLDLGVADNRKAIAANGGLELVLAVIRTHQASTSVIISATEALRQLADDGKPPSYCLLAVLSGRRCGPGAILHALMGYIDLCVRVACGRNGGCLEQGLCPVQEGAG